MILPQIISYNKHGNNISIIIILIIIITIVIIIIIIIIILIVIDSYIIIKNKDNDNDDENNTQNIDNKNYFKKYSSCEWTFLTITITITTNKTIITDKALTGEKRKKKTYLLHANYEKTPSSNIQCKNHVH